MSSANRIIRIHGPYVSKKKVKKLAVYYAHKENLITLRISQIFQAIWKKAVVFQMRMGMSYIMNINIVRSRVKLPPVFYKVQIGYNEQPELLI